MKYYNILNAFGIAIDREQSLQSLYAYAPVYLFNYAGRDYVLKRTGVRSDAKAIAAWTSNLVSQGIKSVAPVENFGYNPRQFLNEENNQEENWVIYPFITGIPYTGNTCNEWTIFLEGYNQHIQPTNEEKRTWENLLLCAWIDQALWLLSHFPEGWADLDESFYLLSLLTTHLSDFSLLL